MKLERILSQSYAINSVRITKEAFEKIKKYARLTSKIMGQDMECSGLLIGSRNDDVARDAMLLEQDVGVNSCNYINNSVAEACKYKVVGIWHSHGSHPVFHSYYDDGHLKKIYILNSRKPPIKVNDKVKEIKGIEIDGKSLVIKISDWCLRIYSPNPRLLKALVTNVEKIKPEYFNFANSIVINKDTYEGKNSYYAESLVQKTPENPRNSDIKNTRKLKNLELAFVNENNNIILDDKSLLKEIGNKLRYDGLYLRDNPNFKRAKQGLSNYRTSMQDLYTNYVIENEIDKAVCTIARILAGDSRRMWLWKDRIKSAIKEYKQIRKKMNMEQQTKLNKIIETVKRHRYANKKYPKKLKSIYRMEK